MLRDCHRNKAKKWTMDSRLSIILFVINYFNNAHLNKKTIKTKR